MNWVHKHWMDILLIGWCCASLAGAIALVIIIGESDVFQKLAGWVQYGLTHIPEPPK